jgi:hypothetical protein
MAATRRLAAILAADVAGCPTTSNCGTGASVAGNDNAGRLIVGTAPPNTYCTITFARVWTNSAICHVANETSSIPARDVFPQLSASTLAIVNKSGATMTAGDTLSYSSVGYQ